MPPLVDTGPPGQRARPDVAEDGCGGGRDREAEGRVGDAEEGTGTLQTGSGKASCSSSQSATT